MIDIIDYMIDIIDYMIDIIDNWYHGYNKYHIPTYNVDTCAPFGNIHTPSFGEYLDTETIETNLRYNIRIYIPDSVKKFKQKPYGNNDCRYPDGYDHNDRNIYLNIEVDKVTMRDILSGKDELRIGRDFIKPASRKFVKVYNEADFHNSYTYIQIVLDRKVSLEDIRKLNLHMMPGFNVTWYYSVEDFLHLARLEMRLSVFRELLSLRCINLKNLCAHHQEEVLRIPKHPQLAKFA